MARTMKYIEPRLNGLKINAKRVEDQCKTTCTNPDNYNGGSERGAEGKKRVVGSYRIEGRVTRVFPSYKHYQFAREENWNHIEGKRNSQQYKAESQLKGVRGTARTTAHLNK